MISQRAVPILLVLLAACGGSEMPRGVSAQGSGGSGSADQANVARLANEPRQNDPTAAPPPPRPVSPPKPTASVDPSASAKTSDPPTRIGARHVLIQWMGTERAPTSVVRSQDQALALAQEVLRRARAGEDFARLVVEYSDEPNAAARGGSLGRFAHGQMVPAFEAAAFRLTVGQISDIVESPFGYHIIQRTE